MLINVMNNQQIDAQQKMAIPSEPQPIISGLAGHVRKCWEIAYRHKQSTRDQLLKNLYQFNSKYESGKLEEIRKMKGSEVYISLTATKCNAAIAWISDIYFQQGGKMWSMEPTPEPEIPMDKEQAITMEVFQEAVQILMAAYGDDTVVGEQLQSLKDVLKERVMKRIKEESEKMTAIVERKMDDQLVEGDWQKALKECIFDLVVYKTAFLKGPVPRKDKYYKRILDPNTGTSQLQMIEKIVPTWERRSPFNIYPSPDATDTKNGYIIDKITITPKVLYSLIGVEGYNEKEIRAVLNENNGGKLRDWTTYPDTEIRREETGGSLTTLTDTENIDVIELWGSIQGKLLLEWQKDISGVEDVDDYYDVCVWLIGERVVYAMLNYDPLGAKPYHKSSYIDVPNSIWGKGLPELIVDLQSICNAVARALVNNAGIASGPLVEIDSDRVDTSKGFSIYPWRIIESTDTAMKSSRAVEFYQPIIVVEPLLKVFQFFSSLADQYAVPSYSHGDLQVGGAGNTASGLSMLMGFANRVIKNTIRSLDSMVESAIKSLYNYNMYQLEEDLHFGDVKIIAKGSSGVIQKEQQSVRRNEFIQTTTNDFDLAILGTEGRKELLYQMAKTLELENIDKLFNEQDDLDKIQAMIQQTMVDKFSGGGGQEPAKKAKSLNSAGQTMSGQDNRLIKQSQVGQQRT